MASVFLVREQRFSATYVYPADCTTQAGNNLRMTAGRWQASLLLASVFCRVLTLGGQFCRCASAPAQYTGFHRHAQAMPGYEVSSSASFHIKTRQSLAAPKCSGPRRTKATMMPVGVPRVPYRLPRTNYWAWVDIWNCLYRERIVFLSKVRLSRRLLPVPCPSAPSWKNRRVHTASLATFVPSHLATKPLIGHNSE